MEMYYLNGLPLLCVSHALYSKDLQYLFIYLFIFIYFIFFKVVLSF
uniref:Uncharacterized protein n=1 Tax=Anguilla anguilla TaxID=7936 RepID=A0A0E9QCJ2_ANGAN